MNLKTKNPKLQTSNPKPSAINDEPLVGGINKAFERGESVGCRALQVFTKNNNQWYGKPLTDADSTNYKTAQSKSNIAPVIAHDSYLINLCASNNEILEKSKNAFIDELHRCEMLGIPYLNFHPGSHTGKGEEDGIKLIIDSLNTVHAQTNGFKVLSVLETTAGQGTAIGYWFEHLKSIIDGVDQPDRMAVCIDTCHIFGAGYDISTEEGYEKTMKEFGEIIGFDRLVAFHVNDSKKPCGSRVDRHEHIGKGAIGELGFKLLMHDERFASIPKILETLKGDDLEEDRMNLATLRRLYNKKTSRVLEP